jgi:hypothetical protein
MSPDSPCHRFAAPSLRQSLGSLAVPCVLLFCITLSGCAGVSGGKSVISPTPGVSLTPSKATIPSGGQQQFAATVTNADDTAVTWSVSQGTITQAGLFTAPSVSAMKTVNVTATSMADANADAVVSVTVDPAATVAIANAVLPNAAEGVAYSQSLSASGGTQPYTWTTASGALPPGIHVSASTGAISGMTGQSGQFNFTVQVADSSSPQQTASLPLAMNVQASGVQRVAPQFFGMHINRRNSTYPMPTIPFGGYRTIDSYRTLWNGVETSAGVYDFATVDSRLADAQAANVDVLYTIYGTPTFHSSNPSDSTCGVGAGSCEPPIDVNADGSGTDASLIAFLTALVNHVGSQIQYYEVWNEVNITIEYNGTWPQLLRMAQDARSTILAVNPNAKILSPSFAELTYPSAAAKMAAYLATSLNGSTGSDAADIINFHGYVVTPALPSPIAEYEVVNLTDLRADLSPADLAKPLWDGEWGPSNGLGDPDLNSSFIARHLLIDAGLGIVRSYYFDWDSNDQRALWSNTLTDCLNTGTANAAGFLCEAGTAYQQAETWLLGNTAMQPCSGPLPPATGVWTCAILTPNGTQTLAVWDTSKTCANGSCTTSNYTNDPRYKQYFTLANSTSTPLTGGTVAIGIKPILLSQ